MTRRMLRSGIYLAALLTSVAGLSTAQAQHSYKSGYSTELSVTQSGSYTPTWAGSLL